MADSWTPDEIQRLIVIVTGCLCLPILVVGAIVLVYLGALTPELLGSIKGGGVGAGLLGLAFVIFQVIKTGLTKDSKR